MEKRKILFLVIFTALGLTAFQIPINEIIGSSQSFTAFELLGPVGGMFLGPLFGALSVFFVKIINIIVGRQVFDFLTIVRFLPAILGAIYFGLKTKKTAFIFPVCIVLFLLNPIGRQAWIYSLIWVIPFLASFLKQRLIFNSLGATFCAHAVGSIIFLYSFGLAPSVWIGLIPVVFIERGFFTAGIWLSYLAINTLLDKLTNLESIKFLKPIVNQDYIVSVKFFKLFA